MCAEINEQLPTRYNLAELWHSLYLECPNLPRSRTQFYLWLQMAYVHSPEAKGGFRVSRSYSQTDFLRLRKFYSLKMETNSLDRAQVLLLEEMEKNPNLYGA